ncbi:RNA exonuclease 4 [Nymphaea colorata]|nr:RNA exonuclease 4 [Nymphaea colorata]
MGVTGHGVTDVVGKGGSFVQTKAGEKPPPTSSLNPNWAQLQAKLKTGTGKPRARPIQSSTANVNHEKSLLGKRKERSDEESSASALAVLTPKNSDCSLTDVVAMDCEMVGVSFQGSKSALGRVSLVNSWGNVVYDEYARPLEYVVDFRSEISGIRPHNLRKAKDFHTVQKDVAQLIKDRILVGHALHHDLKALLLCHPKRCTRDTSHYLPFKNKEGKTRALRDLAKEHLGVEIQRKQHCPIEDARAAMLLYQKYRKEWEKHVKEQRRFSKKQRRRKIAKKQTEKD